MNNRFLSRELVESIRKRYPAGCRVELARMDDPQAPPIGTQGTVTGVDDIGSIMVTWDNGNGLSVAYGVDYAVAMTGESDGNVLCASLHDTSALFAPRKKIHDT